MLGSVLSLVLQGLMWRLMGSLTLLSIRTFMSKTWLPLPGGSHLPRDAACNEMMSQIRINTESGMKNQCLAMTISTYKLEFILFNKTIHTYNPTNIMKLEMFCIKKEFKIPLQASPRVSDLIIHERKRLCTHQIIFLKIYSYNKTISPMYVC